jgi:hypothetical protein
MVREFNILNARGKLPDVDATIELADADGNLYKLKADSTSGELLVYKNGVLLNEFAADLTNVIAFDGTTGVNEIHVTDNAADALSIKITGGNDLIKLVSTDGSEGVTVTPAATFSSTITASGQVTSAGWRNSGAGHFGFGTGEAVTIVSGVATVTKPFVILDAEGAGTTDQLDTITYTGAAGGDLLMLISNATDTITVDDANINLGAATRALAPGGTLLLRYDAGESQWTEVSFLAGADNV